MTAVSARIDRTLHLVRHGQSTWNELRLVQGQQNAPELTELGRRQAAAAAQSLADIGLGAARLLTSDSTRAAQTAEIIGSRFGLRPHPTMLLRELHLGRFEGLSYDDAHAQLADVDLSHPDARYGGSESRNDVLARFLDLLHSELISDTEPGAEIIMVSHGDTIRIALGHLLGDDPLTGPWRSVENGSVATVRHCR